MRLRVVCNVSALIDMGGIWGCIIMVKMWELLKFLGGWPHALAPTTLLGLSCNEGLGTTLRWHDTTHPNQHCYTMDLPRNLSREHMHQALALALELASA